MMPSEAVFRRCRPLLGTFVEISLLTEDSREVSSAVQKAFHLIEEISSSMSFHDPRSELSKFNRTRPGQWRSVSSHFAKILTLCLELQTDSQGSFNVAVGQSLVNMNFLPGRKVKTYRDIFRKPGFEVKNKRARRLYSVKIDLGGVAKGLAVDLASECLQKNLPEVSGFVNAGGDLRVFGPQEQEVFVRTHRQNGRELLGVKLKNSSLATSSVNAHNGISVFIDIKNHGPMKKAKTAVVKAPSCLLADAFTKIVLLTRPSTTGRIAKKYALEWSSIS